MTVRTIPGMLASLLPERTRQRLLPEFVPTSREAWMCGFLELFVAFFFLFVTYMAVVAGSIDGVFDVLKSKPGGEMQAVAYAGGVAAAYGMGFNALATFFLRWQTWAGMYFVTEGIVRTAAGAVSMQVVPTLPLALAESTVLGVRGALRWAMLPARCADEVLEGRDGELHITSSRSKDDWNSSVTICYKERLYELAESFSGPSRRPWGYRLTPAPAHKVVRGVRLYDPEEHGHR